MRETVQHVVRSMLPRFVLAGAGYLLVVQTLRYHRRQALEDLYQQGTQHGKKKALDPEIARQIQFKIATLEFPLVYRLSLEFALFRTYAIPSISKLLEQTRQFQLESGKRYDDTDLLIAEMTQNPFGSERSVQAIQRINAIHNVYRNEITNDDMLYVLSVFIIEPKRWMERYEWRSLTRHEYEAMFVSWKKIGQEFGIENIPDTIEEYEAWNEAYEAKYMVHADSNVIIANATIALFLKFVPKSLHALGHHAAYCLMDSRLRAAMGFPKKTLSTLQTVLDWTLSLRKYVIRYLCLPRPHFLHARRSPFAPSVGSNGQLLLCPRYHVYDKTYPNGYETARLGTAPAGKFMMEHPKWKNVVSCT